MEVVHVFLFLSVEVVHVLLHLIRCMVKLYHLKIKFVILVLGSTASSDPPPLPVP